jgi:hypothetical protein
VTEINGKEILLDPVDAGKAYREMKKKHGPLCGLDLGLVRMLSVTQSLK